jgi:hypothetical protein
MLISNILSAPSLYSAGTVLSNADPVPPPGAAPNYDRGLQQFENGLSGHSTAGPTPTLWPFVQAQSPGTPVSQLRAGALFESFAGAVNSGSEDPAAPAVPLGPNYDQGLQQLENALSGQSTAGPIPALSLFVQAESRRTSDSHFNAGALSTSPAGSGDSGSDPAPAGPTYDNTLNQFEHAFSSVSGSPPEPFRRFAYLR